MRADKIRKPLPGTIDPLTVIVHVPYPAFTWSSIQLLCCALRALITRIKSIIQMLHQFSGKATKKKPHPFALARTI